MSTRSSITWLCDGKNCNETHEGGKCCPAGWFIVSGKVKVTQVRKGASGGLDLGSEFKLHGCSMDCMLDLIEGLGERVDRDMRAKKR